MTDIIIPGKKRSVLDKNCPDFVKYDDGTIAGEKKYCNLSFQCKQLGMHSDFVRGFDPKTGEQTFHDYLCTGIYAIFEERDVDEEAD